MSILPLSFAERIERCNPPKRVVVDEAILLPPGTPPRIAIVGSRASTAEAHRFAVELAGRVAAAGAIVVSGGALGIDAAAHEGALAVGGATWAVVPSGPEDVPYPVEHAALFARINASAGGRLIYAAPNGSAPIPSIFFKRNGLLVALADAVVIVQAGLPSGALNAAKWARDFHVPLWVVPATPWDAAFAGNTVLLANGNAQPLWGLETFFASVGLATSTDPAKGAKEVPHRPRAPSTRRSGDEKRPSSEKRLGPPKGAQLHSVPQTLPLLPESARRALLAVGPDPRHVDEIALRSGLTKGALAEALLTLTLETVVEEGPAGFYRTP